MQSQVIFVMLTLNNDGGPLTDADKTMIGDPNPDYTFGSQQLVLITKDLISLWQASGVARKPDSYNPGEI
jgi:hypothetical protein